MEISLNRIIRYEGLIVKNLEAKYKPAERDSSCWIKLKADYIDALGDTLDLIILGGYYGKGLRRSGGISHFLLGVAERTPKGEYPQKFYTFVKVGSGYSLDELALIKEKLKNHWKPYVKNHNYEYLFGYYYY